MSEPNSPDKPSFAEKVMAQPEQKFSKAEVMLYERTRGNQKNLVVSYNEGRFSRDGKYMVLPKGSIDSGESPLVAGIREFSEETGFNLEDFLGAKNIELLKQRHTLEHISNSKYPNISIVKFDPTLYYTHTYHSRNGNQHALVMFDVEVKGIEHIAQHFKNREGKTTKQLLNANRDIPRFPIFLEWLKQGKIPADGQLPEVTLCDPRWLALKIHQHAPKGFIEALDSQKDVPGRWQSIREGWQRFCHNMEQDEGYPVLRAAFNNIKKRMKSKGYIDGDKGILKFDEKDCPLFWYTEGGHIGAAKDIFKQTLQDMEQNPDYERAFGGKGTLNTGHEPGHEMLFGQVAAYCPFIRGLDVYETFGVPVGPDVTLSKEEQQREKLANAFRELCSASRSDALFR